MSKVWVAVAIIVVVVAAAIVAWLLLRDDDDGGKTTKGNCGGATYELNLEDEGNGLELTFELQSGAPEETWKVVVEQDGKQIFSGDRQTDEDSELDLDVSVDESDGTDFTVTATPQQGSGTPCTVNIGRS